MLSLVNLYCLVYVLLNKYFLTYLPSYFTYSNELFHIWIFVLYSRRNMKSILFTFLLHVLLTYWHRFHGIIYPKGTSFHNDDNQKQVAVR